MSDTEDYKLDIEEEIRDEIEDGIEDGIEEEFENEIEDDIIIELDQYYLDIKKEEKEEILNRYFEYNLKTLIEIKSLNKNFLELQNIIDHAILINKKNVDITNVFDNKVNKTTVNTVLSYYIIEYFKNNNLSIPKLKYNKMIDHKKKELLNLFYRITNNNFVLLYTVINNFKKTKKIINGEKSCFESVKNDHHGNSNSVNDKDSNDNDSIGSDDFENNKCAFLDIFKKKIISKNDLKLIFLKKTLD